jgi:hypothetical protein
LKLKSALLSFTTIILSEPAVAGANLSSFPEVTLDTGGDGTAGLVMLLVIGALILLNGPNGINRSQAKTPAQTADDDDEIIMKF